MDKNDSVRLTRREFEYLVKRICGPICGPDLATAKLPFSPATVSKISCEVTSDPATQKTLQDFLMGACG